jgi:eukaryotic translation initiation factor 2-alpha kinase 4
MYQKAAPFITGLKDVCDFCERLGVTTKINVCPMYTWNEVTFANGTMFCCAFDRKKGRDVFGAGGRFDSLIKTHRPRLGEQDRLGERCGVGFSMNLQKLVHTTSKRMVKPQGEKLIEEEDHAPLGTKRVCTTKEGHDCTGVDADFISAMFLSPVSTARLEIRLVFKCFGLYG